MSQINKTIKTNPSNLRLKDNEKSPIIKSDPDDVSTKTILITNITQNGGNQKVTGENKTQRRSITILTSHHNDDSMEDMVDSDDTTSEIRGSAVVLDRINICINNHFNDISSLKSSTTTTTTTSNESKVIRKDIFKEEPDSTTNTSANQITRVKENFCNGQDVLVQQKDGCLYLGTVVAVANNQCLVKFGDNTERWSSFDELSKLNSNDTDDSPICVVCKKNNSSETVEVCEKCGRGYHEKCTEGDMSKNGVWYCRRCTAENRIRNKESKSMLKDPQSMCSDNSKTKQILFNKNELPYIIDALKWDSYHRVNEEQIYCYCGGNGRWYTQMLQCVRCEQWFHENCIRCIQYPLYCGDRFYLFVCSMCNYGTEFLRRLELNWQDLVHLLLFNLTIYNSKKYYDLQTVIIPYAADNWDILQLPTHIKNLSKIEIEANICETLKAHRTRFKNGKEIKKSIGIWSLRTRIPPPRLHIVIPNNVPITEIFLNEHLPASLKMLKPIDPSDFIIQNESKIQQLMTGFAFINDNFDNESTSSTESNIDLTYNSDDEISLKDMTYVSQKLKSEKGLTNSINFNNDTDVSNDNISDDGDEMIMDDDNKMCDTIISTHLNSLKSKVIEIFDSSDETSRGTLDLIIPPPKNFQGKNNPFHRQQSFENLEIKQNKLIINNDNNINKKAKRKQSNNHHHFVNIQQHQLQNPFQNISTMLGNTTSTLPKNENFLNFDKSSAGQHRIIRTIKRRLSDKDLIIGPNQEIKKRKYRRRSSANVEVISTQIVHAASKSAYLPTRLDGKEFSLSSSIPHSMSSTSTSSSSTSNGTPNESLPPNVGNLTNIFNGRRLRQRAEKNYSDNPRRSSVTNNPNNSHTISFSLPCSPTKNSEVTISELKSTVNVYFGAANRIASGERFAIKGTRSTSEGLTNYLVQWEGLPQSS